MYPYEVARLIADMAGDRAAADRLDEAILRLDPQHPEALARRAGKAASAPGVPAAQAATLYADALAAAPDSEPMRQGLDEASYRLLRGIRWLALLCLALAGVGVDLFATDGETQRELPLPLGQRLWDLVPMAVVWTLGALLEVPRLRGVRVNLRSLVRPPRLGPDRPRAGGVGDAVRPARRRGPVDGAHGPAGALLGGAAADPGDDVVRPEEDQLPPGPARGERPGETSEGNARVCVPLVVSEPGVTSRW
ncbi:hypothetical protein SGLAM104S_06200 [Streptomyces glaucescens]